MVIDSQSVKTTEIGGERGYDGHKKIQGRNRHVVVHTLGLLIAVVATAASVDDGVAAPLALEQLTAERCSRLAVVWTDGKYHNDTMYNWMADENVAWHLEVVSRQSDRPGFVVVWKRWVVERTHAWLGRARRLSKDYGRRTDSSEWFIRVRSIQLLLNRMEADHITPPFRYPRIS